MFWEISIAMLILYGCLEIPFTIAFIKHEHMSTGQRIWDYTIDSIMLLDCLLTFFTGYVDADDHVTMDQRKIARHYLRTWFFIDFLSALPIDEFTPVLRELRMVRIVRMVRMLRIQKLVRYVKRWEESTSVSHSAVRLVQLILTSFFWVHLDACMLFAVSSLQDFPEGNATRFPFPFLLHAGTLPSSHCLRSSPPARLPASTGSWVYGPPAALPVQFIPESWAIMECYTHIFFTALSNMLCVSYGLGGPTRIEEMWAFVISMALGASMYAIVLAFACNVMTSTDYASRLYQNQLEVLNEFMRVRTLPRSLRDRLRKTLEMSYPNKRLFTSSALESEVSGQQALAKVPGLPCCRSMLL